MDFLERNRRLLLFLVGALTLFFLFGATLLRVNFSFDRFYPKDSADFQYYKTYQERFGQDQNLTLYIALSPKEGDIFNPDFLRQADAIFSSLQALPGMDTALFLTQLRQVQRSGPGFSVRPIFSLEPDEDMARVKEKLRRDPTLYRLFVTRSDRHAVGYFRIDASIFDTGERDKLSAAVDKTLEYSGLNYVVSGLPYIRSQYVWKIATELGLFTGLSFLLILTVLGLIYRSVWGVVVPVLTVLACMIWVAGLMGWTGQQIDLLNNMLIPIMFVVGMSDVIHLVTKYVQERKSGISAEEAVRTTLREIGLATFLTSFTTAIGFASLGISRIPPIQILGLIAAIGVMLAWALTLVVIPLWLKTGHDRGQVKDHTSNSITLRRIVDRLENWVYRHPRRILLGFGLLSAASMALALMIPRDTFLLEDVGQNDPIRGSMEFFEKESFGVRPFEAGVTVKEGYRLTDVQVLKLLEGLEKELDQSADFSPFLSPVSLITEANYISGFRRESARKIPDTQEEVDELVSAMVLAGGAGNALNQVMDTSFTYGRMSARLPDMSAYAFGTVTDRMNAYLKANDPNDLVDVSLTGNAVLTENNLRYIRKNLLQGLGLALGAVGMLMGILFRSVRMAVISLIPNVVPLLFTAGIMGIFGLPLTASSSIVFVVAFGIALDDTIHMLTRFRSELQRGTPKEEAIRITMRQTGEAMILTSVVLIAGFSLLTLSDFGATFNVGLLTSLTIAFALIADLLLLPVLLRYFLPQKSVLHLIRTNKKGH
jgi:hypothetical protein